MAVVGELDYYLCRLCATKTGILMSLPIFDSGGSSMRNIDKKIAACLPVRVSTSDELPKVVCENCAYKLDDMFEFREKCLHTESMFVEMLKEMRNEARGETRRTTNSARKTLMADDRDGRVGGEAEGANDEGGDECGDRDGTGEDSIRGLRAIDEMDLAGDEQVVGRDEMESRQQQQGDLEVAGIHCLDGDTVRMVDEHIREVSNHEIAMHLEGDMTVVGNLTVDDHLGQLGINYVTTMEPENQNSEQIVHYCDNVKYETVVVKDEYQRLQGRLDADPSQCIKNDVGNEVGYPSSNNEPETSIDDPTTSDNENSTSIQILQQSQNVPSTSQKNAKRSTDIIVEYTKMSKDSVLENILNNPTFDVTGSNWYVCPFCNEAATEQNNLVTHFDQHFCCCPCGLYFTSVENLTIHEEQCPLNKTSMTNEILQSKSSKTKIFTNFEETNDDDDDKKKNSSTNMRQKWTPKICSQCGKQYRTNYKLQEHMRKHTGEKPFKCQTCEKSFRSKIGLAQHTATHTGEFDFTCSTCGKGFQCKSYLIVHQRVHSDLKPYNCSTCGQNFKTKQSLLDHENRHLGVKPYICEVCGRGFITKGLCKSHQKIHSGKDNRQYPCEVCNKMFVSKSYLNTHMRIHTGEKPYLCEVCGKGFLTRVDLKIHSTMHTGEKSFKCDICAKVFARSAALRCHRRSHTGERPYRCDVCGKTFTQFSPMAIHKRLHTGERPYECEDCGKTFVSRSTMMCHRKKHHLGVAQARATQATAAAKEGSGNCGFGDEEKILIVVDVRENGAGEGNEISGD